MTDVTFEILAGGDDGYANIDDSDWNNSVNNIRMGHFLLSRHAFFRFDNVSIPANAVIGSAVIRFISSFNYTLTTSNLNIHFEDADDPAAPTSGSDLTGRSLTAAVAWSSVPGWTQGNSYDSVDIASILQDVIDRGGWASGQAVIVNIVDNGSSSGRERGAASYENTSYASAQLVVSYSVPYSFAVSESLEISESVSIESDLIREENISIQEGIEALLGFDESLPLISQDVEISEFVALELEFVGPKISVVEDVEISEDVALELEFVGPKISVVEDVITITDNVLMVPGGTAIDVTFEILATSDDGFCGTDGVNFQAASISYNPFGRTTSRPYRSWYRFDNVTIPPEAYIASATLRVTSDNTVNWNDIYNNVYFEAADDPDAPINWTDLNSRALGSAVAWDHTGYWDEDSTYDSSDIRSILQAVVDRTGWDSGQAVQVHLVDDGTLLGRYKRIFSEGQDVSQSLAQSAQLVVTYHTLGDVVDSLAVGDDVDAFNLSDDLPDSFGADDTVAAFSLTDDLPDSLTVDDDVDATELTVDLPESFGLDDASDSDHERTMPPLQNSFDLDADIDALYIQPYAEMSFTVSGLSDAFKLTEDVPDSFGVADIMDGNREHEVFSADEFVLADEFDAFNYSAWLKANLAVARLRFFCTITGAADLQADVEIPIRSFYARKKSGDPSYLQVVVPGFEYAAAVAARPNGELILEIGYEVAGVVSLREQISVVDIDEISTYDGGVNRSITVAGHRTIFYGKNYIEIDRNLATYHALQKNVLSYRFAQIDPYLNPGDTLVVGETAMTVNNVIYIVDPLRSTMQVSEA